MTAGPGDPGPPPGRTVPGNRWDLLDDVWPEVAPRVSVIVVHYAQQRRLDRTLAALARQTHPAASLEVIVVDDGSPEPPRVPRGVTLRRQEDRGFRAAAARNLGAAAAQGEVLCFLDADTTPEPDYVRRLTRLPAVAPEAVTVGRRRHADLSGAEEGVPVEVAGPAHALTAPAWLEEAYARSGDLLRADDGSYRYVISAVLGCSRWFHDHVGGFDEGFAEYGGEDWEWAHRAWLAGAVLAHVPGAVAWHDGPDWSGRPADDAARRAAKNAETLRLADAVPVAGSRGRAVRTVRADVIVRLRAASSPAAAFVCVDTLLAALPEAIVTVPDDVAATFAADPRVLPASAGAGPHLAAVRVVVEVAAALRAGRDALRTAVDRVGAEGLGALELTGTDGAPLLRVTSRRAEARATRWGTDALFPVLRERADWLAPVDGEPDLEAYVGGWG